MTAPIDDPAVAAVVDVLVEAMDVGSQRLAFPPITSRGLGRTDSVKLLVLQLTAGRGHTDLNGAAIEALFADRPEPEAEAAPEEEADDLLSGLYPADQAGELRVVAGNGIVVCTAKVTWAQAAGVMHQHENGPLIRFRAQHTTFQIAAGAVTSITWDPDNL